MKRKMKMKRERTKIVNDRYCFTLEEIRVVVKLLMMRKMMVVVVRIVIMRRIMIRIINMMTVGIVMVIPKYHKNDDNRRYNVI